MAAHRRGIEAAETERLQALGQYGILDTPPEREYDEIVEFAARVCETPMATVTFVDERRQWFKARIGLPMRETSRDIAFCAHAIGGREPFVIHDARIDPRFADNPLVRGPPYIVFYSGFPLVDSNGLVLGTLGVMDTVPRELSPLQHQIMEVLARSVVARLELRHRSHHFRELHEQLLQEQQEMQRAIEVHGSDVARTQEQLEYTERLYRSLWETTTDSVLMLDTDSVIQYANPATERVFGHAPGALVGKPLALLQPERLRAAHTHGLRRYLESGRKRLDWRATETVGLRADGSELPIEIAFSEFEHAGRRVFVGFVRDITARRHAEAALAEEKTRAQATLHAIGDGVIASDGVGRITFLNPMAEQITGWKQAEALGRPLEEALRLIDEATGEPLDPARIPAADASADADAPVSVPLPATTMLHAKSGERLSVEGSVARLRDSDGGPAGWVVAFRDVSRYRQLAEEMSYQATHDALTGLFNRAEFDRRLRLALESAAVERRQHSMLYMDLDQFKVVNDTCGHVAGDELLRQLVGVLSRHLRSSDIFARLGGDEFGVLLENCAPEPALRVTNALLEAAAGFSFTWGESTFQTTLSIGHVSFADHGLTVNEILSHADEACYVAKEHGRNRSHSYHRDDELLARRHGEMRWVGEIHRALAEDRFVLHAQPIFDVADPGRQPRHYEFLLRLLDHDGGLVSPMEFIPAAERFNLMSMLDHWVIDRAFAHVAECVRRGDAVESYAVNLSGASFSDAALSGDIAARLSMHGIPPRMICFEITETAVIGNLTRALTLIHELKRLGCSFALDDFGSGMSSFAYLKQLPVDILKIDGSFVRNIATDRVDRAMVASINEVGHVMGLRTVAEFVESVEVLEELRRIGVDLAQGYGLARPAPLRY